jgi:hypothetical protein
VTDDANPVAEAVDNAVQDQATAVRRGRLGIPGIALAIVAGLVYAFFFWNALSHVVNLPLMYAEPRPWGLAVAGVFVPVITYVAAFVVAFRRGLGGKLLVYLLGLVVLSALSLSLIGIESIQAADQPSAMSTPAQ